MALLLKVMVNTRRAVVLSVRQPRVVGRRIEVVAVMGRWKPDDRNLSGTVELGRAYS